MKVNLIVPGYPARVGHTIPAIELHDALIEKGVNAEISCKPKEGYINHAHVNSPYETKWIKADLYTLYGPPISFRDLGKKLMLNPSHFKSKQFLPLVLHASLNLLPPALKPKLIDKVIITTCNYLKRHLNEHFITKNIITIPPALKPPRIHINSQNNREIILFTGKGFKERGELEILKISPLILKKHPDAEFYIANKMYERYKHKYDRIVRKLGIDSKVRFFGNLKAEEIYKLLEKCSVAVYPYITTHTATSVPISLIEAMLHGKPVISTNIGAIPELIENGKTGILIEPEDREALARSVIKFLDEPKTRKQLGDNAFKIARERNNPLKVAEKYIRIYEKLEK